MKRLSVMILSSVLLIATSIRGQPPTCKVRETASIRMSLPLDISPTAGLSLVKIAVDEVGNIYASFSVRDGTRGERAYLLKSDPMGRILWLLPLESPFGENTKAAHVSSLHYHSGRIYLSALWYGLQWRNQILVFDTLGKLEHVFTPDGFYAYHILSCSDDTIYAAGTRGGTDFMIFKISRSGEITPFVTDVEGALFGRISPTHPQIAMDGKGRILSLLPDGALRIFDHKGSPIRTLSGDQRFDDIIGWKDGMILARRVDVHTQQRSLAIFNERGEHLCGVEVMGRLSPMVRGPDGYFYGYGVIGVRPGSPQRELLIAKFKIDQPSN
ncbi:MAG TPA: hypothetical protein VNM72_09365 [Blastocatellia bacterium]|nr:hypothetical protein [Blastocatellia bacterium]